MGPLSDSFGKGRRAAPSLPIEQTKATLTQTAVEY